MSRIVMAAFGSLGDLHPFIALALELRERGHQVSFATLEYYREKLETLGFEFHPTRPNVSPDDAELAADLMDAKKGTEMLLREFLLPTLPESYADLLAAAENADLIVAGEVVFAAPLVAEKLNKRWVSTSLAPASFLSAYDPMVPPTAQWLGKLRFLGPTFHKILYSGLKRSLHSWWEPVRELRRRENLKPSVDPVFKDKFSPFLHLALFSPALGAPQPDWHQPTVQPGFPFYDGKRDTGKMPVGLKEFLAAGEPPIIFTLGSAAVWAAGNFYEESARAAKILNRRAVLLIGQNAPPKNLDETIAAYDYAPFSEVFPFAAAIVHQGGIGTTSQVLRAGAPHLFMPFSHDQFDNAARCVRLGVARTIARASYSATAAAGELNELLTDLNYKNRASEIKSVVDAENGVKSACDAIENVLN
ncbi:MAG TPA: glycosyltransferase [Pyrinomonadaceae bacterium]|jgi:UDP:flavonoid glycosyltransferase YjiC (YdhE family)